MDGENRQDRGVSDDGECLWSVRWHGYRRVFGEGGLVTEEVGSACELRVMVEGDWIVCGGDGCVVVAAGDAGRFERLAVCLLGRSVVSRE